MKNMKKVITILLVLSLVVVIAPMPTQAAVTPMFVAVNDTILPLSVDNSPLISGGEVFVPPSVFSGLRIWQFTDLTQNFVRVYVGRQGVDFWIDENRVMDLYGNDLHWPNARRVGDRVYVPLQQISTLFRFSWELTTITESIIPGGHMRLLRLRDENAIFNTPTLIGINSASVRQMYNAFFHPPPPMPPDPGEDPPEEIIPTFPDVSVYLSFFYFNNGSAERIMDILRDVSPDYRAAFFVRAREIIENPGLMRKIHGSGHTLGIWLEEGTVEEYRSISALLFEAAKVRTIFVSAYEAGENAFQMAENNGLIFWGATESFYDFTYVTEIEIIETFPVESGARSSYRFAGTDDLIYMLPDIIEFLYTFEYSVERIFETVEPLEWRWDFHEDNDEE